MADKLQIDIRNIPIVFIVGRGNSGTTLLQTLANSHPNIVATHECFFVITLYPHFGKIKNWTERDIFEFVGALNVLQIFTRWSLDREELTQKLLSVMGNANYPLLCKMVYYQMRKDKEKVLILMDKNPLNSLFIEEIIGIFPEAKFIHIVRDPRDNVNSSIRRFNKKNTPFLARKWVGFNAYIETMKHKFPDRFFTIIYEEMVTNTENTFKSLCKYLVVPYSNLMMNNQFSERLQSYEGLEFYERVKKTHQSLLEPVNTNSIGRWEKEMSEHDRAITEIIAADFANKYYGYDIKRSKESRGKISSLKLFKSRIQYSLWAVFTKFRFANYKINMYYYKRKNRPKQK